MGGRTLNIDTYPYWLWLHETFGSCNAKFRQALRLFENDITALYENRSDPAVRALIPAYLARNNKQPDLDENRRRLEVWASDGIRFICYDDDLYPQRLRDTRFAPSGLFVTGDPSVMDSLSIAGVGSRVTTTYGREAVKKICAPIASAGITLVSGLAYGIDSEVHRAALDNGAKTVAVLGTAIDVTYPANHRELRRMIEKNGAVVSEYEPGTKGERYMFPQRNRIISGLSCGVIIFEAARKSGTMITANWALDDGREVFAVPGSIFSERCEGTNYLISQGAVPATAAEDVLGVLGLDLASAVQMTIEGFSSAPVQGLSKRQQLIYDSILSGADNIETLVDNTGLQPHELFSELTVMEIDGIIESGAGSSYSVKRII